MTKVTATTNSAKAGWVVTVAVSDSNVVQTPFGSQETSANQYYSTKVLLTEGGNLAQPPMVVGQDVSFDLDDFDVKSKTYQDGGETKSATWLFPR